jgi:hypothetical protein
MVCTTARVQLDLAGPGVQQTSMIVKTMLAAPMERVLMALHRTRATVFQATQVSIAQLKSTSAPATLV